MTKVTIKETQNPTILKFEFPDFITQNENFEFKNIDEAGASPLAQQHSEEPKEKATKSPFRARNAGRRG